MTYDFYTRRDHIEESISHWQNLLHNTECPIADARGYKIENVYIVFRDGGNVYSLGVYEATTGEKKGEYRFNLETGQAAVFADDRYTSDGWDSACSYLSDILGNFFGDPDERPFQLINKPDCICIDPIEVKEYSNIEDLMKDLVRDITDVFRDRDYPNPYEAGKDDEKNT